MQKPEYTADNYWTDPMPKIAPKRAVAHSLSLSKLFSRKGLHRCEDLSSTGLKFGAETGCYPVATKLPGKVAPAIAPEPL
jgi:hypothetical protein